VILALLVFLNMIITLLAWKGGADIRIVNIMPIEITVSPNRERERVWVRSNTGTNLLHNGFDTLS
jgi:hypothetical protein